MVAGHGSTPFLVDGINKVLVCQALEEIGMKIRDYNDALAFIHQRPRFKKKPTLVRMRDFLKRLGNPQSGQRYLHVTGTNGKGSVVAMARRMLMEQGLSVGSFTSPFITRFNERIAIDGQPISDDDLVKYTQRIAPVVEVMDQEWPDGGPTEFEIDTAIMFCYFADQDLDAVILEVGIGGLYDSTNVIDDPVATAIVTVGYDHMKYLGDSLAAIAKQKAGIIKKHSPVVIGNLSATARQVVETVAKQKQASLFEWNRDYQANKVGQRLIYPTIKYSGLTLYRERYQLSLAGDYQVENAAVAITLVQLFMKALGLLVDRRELRTALNDTHWPGRMELINEEPLVILDGAHNLPGMQALVKTIQDDFQDREVYLLVAILADKQYDLMLGELASLGNVHITVTSFAGPYPGRASADLADVVKELPSHHPIQVIDEWRQAFANVVQNVSAEDVILVTGSLYFISDVRHLMLD